MRTFGNSDWTKFTYMCLWMSVWFNVVLWSNVFKAMEPAEVIKHDNRKADSVTIIVTAQVSAVQAFAVITTPITVPQSTSSPLGYLKDDRSRLNSGDHIELPEHEC